MNPVKSTGGDKVDKTNWLEHRDLYVILAITLIAFIVFMCGMVLLWSVLQPLGISSDLWTMIGALSTAGGAATIVGAGVFGYRELTEIATSRHMEVADRLFTELNSKDNIVARRWVFQNLPDDPEEGLGSLSEEGRDAVKRVLNSMDRVAFLTQFGWIPEEKVMPWMNPMIVKSWMKLKPYVDYESQRRGEPDYYLDARRRGERCCQWRAERYGDLETVWLKNAL